MTEAEYRDAQLPFEARTLPPLSRAERQALWALVDVYEAAGSYKTALLRALTMIDRQEKDLVELRAYVAELNARLGDGPI